MACCLRRFQRIPSPGWKLRKASASLARCRAVRRPDNTPFESHPYIQEIATFVSSEGYFRFPTRLLKPELAIKPVVPAQPFPSWEEQKLCIGASFDVTATNGVDIQRRINIMGFCQSTDMLYESVEDAVLSSGGKLIEEDRLVKSGVHEQLKLVVYVPFLWGVPPQLDYLDSAIKSGGGFVHRVYQQWGMY